MKNNQSLEDYLECILLLSKESEFVHRVDVARKTGVSQPAVQKAIKLLEGKEYVKCDGLHIFLTEKGKKYAEEVFDRHCTLKEFFKSLGVSEEAAEDDACRVEHVLSEETFKAIKKSLKK